MYGKLNGLLHQESIIFDSKHLIKVFVNILPNRSTYLKTKISLNHKKS